MSSSKRLLDKLREDRQKKEEALLEIPARVVETQDAIEVLAIRLEESAVQITNLKKQLIEANSLKSKMKDYVVGGIVGAVLGVITSKFIG